MFLIDPYCIFFSTNRDFVIQIKEFNDFIEFLENRNMFSKSIFIPEILEELLNTYPYNDPVFANNFQSFYPSLTKILLCQSTENIDKDHSNRFSNNFYSEFSRNIQELILNKLLNYPIISIVSGDNIELFRRTDSLVIIENIYGDLVKKYNRYSYKKCNKFLPFFIPSPKHSNSTPTKGVTGSILSIEDENDCYKLIDNAIKIKNTSSALIAYNPNTESIIKFHKTQDNEYHAFPITKHEYQTYISHNLEIDIVPN
ncbi:hypothetical protein LLW22_04175 [Enterococcus casseliflavus]|nr:hypothetical protein LLW22_04175 [Enterococcus casseliflavus]